MPFSFSRSRIFTLVGCLAVGIVTYGYNIVMFPGSHIPTHRYQKLATHLQSCLGNGTHVKVETYNPFRRRLYPNDTILVGHSFGGTFALWSAHQPNVRGIVLLYSHFNSRRQMWYPGIDLSAIDVPVLTILGTEDERLPFHKAIEDLFERHRRENEDSVHNKYFLTKRGFRHFSGIGNEEDNDDDALTLASDIASFIQSMYRYDKSVTDEDTCLWFDRSDRIHLPTFTRDLSQSLNLLDALLQTAEMPGWWTFHFLMFLFSKPSAHRHYKFTLGDSLLLKTSHLSKDQFHHFLRCELFPHIEIEWREIVLPSIHPAIMTWLLREPRLVPQRHDSSSLRPWKGEILILPVNDNVTYYRVPNRRWMLSNATLALQSFRLPREE